MNLNSATEAWKSLEEVSYDLAHEWSHYVQQRNKNISIQKKALESINPIKKRLSSLRDEYTQGILVRYFPNEISFLLEELSLFLSFGCPQDKIVEVKKHIVTISEIVDQEVDINISRKTLLMNELWNIQNVFLNDKSHNEKLHNEYAGHKSNLISSIAKASLFREMLSDNWMIPLAILPKSFIKWLNKTLCPNNKYINYRNDWDSEWEKDFYCFRENRSVFLNDNNYLLAWKVNITPRLCKYEKRYRHDKEIHFGQYLSREVEMGHSNFFESTKKFHRRYQNRIMDEFLFLWSDLWTIDWNIELTDIILPPISHENHIISSNQKPFEMLHNIVSMRNEIKTCISAHQDSIQIPLINALIEHQERTVQLKQRDVSRDPIIFVLPDDTKKYWDNVWVMMQYWEFFWEKKLIKEAVRLTIPEIIWN